MGKKSKITVTVDTDLVQELDIRVAERQKAELTSGLKLTSNRSVVVELALREYLARKK